jgi:nitrate/TMAO reductase-like tetraheme cytochrome c subunit
MEFIIKKAYIIIAIVVVAVCVAGLGFIEFSSTDKFCYLCHFHESFTEPWEASAHYKKGTHCADCHIPHDATGFIHAKWNGSRDAIEVMNSDIDYDMIDIVARVPDAECIKCHRAYLKVNLSAGEDMPFEMAIKVDSLYFDHARHEEVTEVCLRCHTREKSYAAVNYMTCGSCHYGLTHTHQDKYDVHVPSADRCSVCHTGRVHVPAEYADGLDDGGLFFYNDCTAAKFIPDGVPSKGENCERCHPPVGPATEIGQ